jgi:galactokinase
MSAGALGARMTGGGFGGAVVALVPDVALDRVVDAIDGVLPQAQWLLAPASAGASVCP